MGFMVGQRPWTPAEISSVLWLDAADADTISSDGGLVSQWRDKSGNANHGNQLTGSKQPTTGAVTYNGRNALSFVGANQTHLEIANPGNFDLGSYTILAVYKMTASGSLCGKCDNTQTPNLTNTARRKLLIRKNPSLQDILASGSDTGNFLFSSDADYTSTDFNMRKVVATSDTNVTYGINGKSYTENPDNATFVLGTPYNTEPFQVGAVFQGDTEAMTGDVGEIILCSGALNDTDVKKVEGYLAWKWGLQGSLPSTHPYKNEPPIAYQPDLWTPAETSTYAWYDASDSSSLTLSGSDVIVINDKSGGNRHLDESQGTNWPSLTTINGRTALDFNPTQENIRITDLAGETLSST
jgi:hypothetical protein